MTMLRLLAVDLQSLHIPKTNNLQITNSLMIFKAISIENFLSLNKTGDNFQEYFDFEQANSIGIYKLYRNLPLADPDLEALNASLSCTYMPGDKLRLLDTEHFHPFPLQRGVRNMTSQETKVYCNCLGAFPLYRIASLDHG